MRPLARILLTIGALVGAVGAILVVTGVGPELPVWVVRIAILKLLFITAAGLLAAGAVLSRAARKRAAGAADEKGRATSSAPGCPSARAP